MAAMAAWWSLPATAWSATPRSCASVICSRQDVPIPATCPCTPALSDRSAAVSNTENLMLDDPALMTRIGSRIVLLIIPTYIFEQIAEVIIDGPSSSHRKNQNSVSTIGRLIYCPDVFGFYPS